MNIQHNIVRTIADLVKARYVFPDLAEHLAIYLNERLSSGAYDAFRDGQLAAQLTDDLRRESNDLHLRVRYSIDAHLPESPGKVVREQNDRAEHCRQMGYGVGAQLHTGGVAILTINELVEPELSRSAYEVALKSIVDAQALVIDLRACVGGDPKTVALVCSQLFDVRTQLSRIVPRASPEEHFWAQPDQYERRFGSKKPVVVAVANFTFSGAEMLAYDLQACGRATIVGETTGGGANPCAFYWPSPHFSLLLPEAASVNPITGTNWEGCGVVADHPCSSEEALNRAIELAQVAWNAG
jgi:hypothetical protein